MTNPNDGGYRPQEPAMPPPPEARDGYRTVHYRTKGLATTSLILAIGGWLMARQGLRAEPGTAAPIFDAVGLLAVLAALVCGHIAIYQAGRGRASGKGRAVAGLVIAYSMLAIVGIGVVAGIATAPL